MKICLFLEGSYPYVRGGVSNWVHSFITNRLEDEFILWTICDSEEKRADFKYDLPPNVVLVQENFLNAAQKLKPSKDTRIRLSQREKDAVVELVTCREPDWPLIQQWFEQDLKSPMDFFQSEAFLEILKEYARQEFPSAGFLDLFYTVRSMFLPLLYLITQPIAEADLYHSLSTGYGGVLGALGAKKYNKPYVLSEHGIYTREREEEILLSTEINPYFKSLWTRMFYMYSRFCYASAHRVTSLFGRASKIQQDLGCPPEKCDVVANGIEVEKFLSIPPKAPDGWVDIGAIVRFHPIKDIKTLIYTFSNLKHVLPNTRLHILGGVDDEDYHQECLQLIDFYGVKDIIVTGAVDTKAYLAKLDFTVLTSISEGQPFAVIESLAAGRPVVATNVGCCRELIEGDVGDDFGVAGITVPPMHQSELLEALIEMCVNAEKRKQMGAVGQKRAQTFFDLNKMVPNYMQVYERAKKQWQASDLN